MRRSERICRAEVRDRAGKEQKHRRRTRIEVASRRIPDLMLHSSVRSSLLRAAFFFLSHLKLMHKIECLGTFNFILNKTLRVQEFCFYIFQLLHKKYTFSGRAIPSAYFNFIRVRNLIHFIRCSCGILSWFRSTYLSDIGVIIPLNFAIMNYSSDSR